jgi:hypothetical protein
LVAVAADALHKANISGGDEYAILVPDLGVDATFRWHGGIHLPFIEYLRLSFRYGGFSGLWGKANGYTMTRSLAEGLQEI